jgi:hypothetical protein
MSSAINTASVSSTPTPLTQIEENKRLREMVEYLMNRLEATSAENNIIKDLLSQSEAQMSHEKRAKECLYKENIKKDEEISKLLTHVIHLQNELRKGK